MSAAVEHLFVSLPEIADTAEAALVLDTVAGAVSYASHRDNALSEAAAAEPAVEVLLIGVREVLTTEVLDRLPHLHLVATLSGGTNHVPLPDLRARDIALVAIPGVNARSVAEHALAMMLAMSKRLREGHHACLVGSERDGMGDRPREMSGRTFGLVGAGHTARALLDLLVPFSGRRLVTTRDPDRHAELSSVELVPFDELFSTADAVSLHVPLAQETVGMVGADQIRSLPPGACVVNCSRVELFDLNGVAAGLRDRPDITVAVDAFGLAATPLADRAIASQVLFSPHVAGVTTESIRAMHLALATEIRTWASHLPG